MIDPLVVDDALNGTVFRRCVEQLALTRRPDGIVVLDDRNVHKLTVARRAIKSWGTELWLVRPRYGPESD